MRRLLYIPIIHTEQDLGSLVGAVNDVVTPLVGVRRQRHKEVVLLYWQEIAKYWEGKNVAGWKIFQDGLPVGGEVGEKIVKSLAETGSINHRIIEQLLAQGAELVGAEDPAALKAEYYATKALVKRASLLGTLWAFLRYRWQKNKLLQARDRYISKSINEHLGEGETGICFLGAYHQILPSLAKDIEVIALKNPEKVREYQQKFTSGKWEEAMNELGAYLTMPITGELGEKDE